MEVQYSELSVFKKLAKSIVSAVDIYPDKKLNLEMLTTKGPGTGISPMKINDVIGKKVKHFIPEDTVINEDDLIW